MKAKTGLLLALVLGLGLVSAVFGAVYHGQNEAGLNGGQSLELVNQMGGTVSAVGQAGDYAYFGVGPRLMVLDVSNSSTPVVVGQSEPLPGNVQDIAISGTHAFVIVGSEMIVVDIGNPADPTPTATFDTPGILEQVVVSGSLVYVAEIEIVSGTQSFGGGLRIINVSNPSNPTQTGYLDLDGRTESVTVWGNYAFIGWSDLPSSEIIVVDVSNPASPAEVTGLNTPLWVQGLATDGNYLYAAVTADGLQIYDISTPSAPSFVSDFDTPGLAYSVAYSGSMVYVADFGGGLRYVDVSNPAVPTDAGAYDLSEPDAALDVVAGENGLVYLAYTYRGLHMLDADGPILEAVYDEPIGSADFIETFGNAAFVHDYPDGLRLMDITDGSNPVELGLYETNTRFFGDVQIVGDLAYFAGGDGMVILDISNHSQPLLEGSYTSPGMYSYGVALSSSYAFLADHNNGLEVIDISDPTAPLFAANVDTAGTVYGLALKGNRLFLADSVEDLLVFDVSEPLTPTLSATYPMTNAAQKVEIVGQYAYVTDAGEGLHILDVSNPDNPAFAGFLPLPYIFVDLAVVDGFAYVMGLTGETAVIDVHNPANPELFGVYDTPSLGDAIDAKDGVIYAAASGSGLYILRPAALTAANDSPTVLGQTTTFTATTFDPGPFSYAWDFGDGNTGSGQVASHTYGAAGEYTAVVVATNITETFMATTAVVVEEETITGLTANNDGPTTLGNSTTLTAEVTTGSNVVYTWNFGDGQTGSGPEVMHTYADAGEYMAVVTATNAISTQTAETIVTVKAVEEKSYVLFIPAVHGKPE